MVLQIFVVQILCYFVKAIYVYDDEETTKRPLPVSDDMEFEPVNPLSGKERMVFEKNISCDGFLRYTLNCTLEAAMIYNSSRKSPPMPAKIVDWCKAIRHLTNCAIDWNSECRDLTESHFNEESIKGHMHVIDNVCDDDWFLARYDDLPICIEAASDAWESCYSNFKLLVDEQKNKSSEWTHFETHFYLCCARAQFRRCTLDSLFGIESRKCTPEQATTLQKFSVIVSDGDVYQDCDFNMMYSNCPGGDPRPTKKQLSKLVTVHSSNMATALNSLYAPAVIVTFCLFDVSITVKLFIFGNFIIHL